MATISNLPNDLLGAILRRVGEILHRVPMSLRAMRSTCKLWNTLLNPISKSKEEIMFITTYNHRACLMSVDLHEHNKGSFIKQIGELKQVRIHKVFHCSSGLLLCLDKSHIQRLRVWNPYTGHLTNWIKPTRTNNNRNGRHFYGMGYDSNNNHKILRVLNWHNRIDCEIYYLKSIWWRILDISMDLNIYDDGVSLKGDNYFLACEGMDRRISCIICFDFTKERVWKLSLPHYSDLTYFNALSVVSEDKLVVLSWRRCTSEIEIWITNKIESIAVSS